jgi:hypothetical protein
LLSFIPYARIWRCLQYEAAVERNAALVRAVAGDTTQVTNYISFVYIIACALGVHYTNVSSG